MPASSRILHGMGFYVSVDLVEPERALQIVREIRDMTGRTFKDPLDRRVTHIIVDIPHDDAWDQRESVSLPDIHYGPDANGRWDMFNLMGRFARPDSGVIVLPLQWLRACQEQQRFVGSGVNEPEYGGFRILIWIDPTADPNDWEDVDEYDPVPASSDSDSMSSDNSMSWAYS
ncbi:uncharacterized protein LOC62_04G006184 [Vanrija pseudolonga]|uniref:BRCT domain-containing protein n=1 Tax=Vanrija pseudolonga TaxID=143232 RepID=A0AAF0Y9T3_9TREE|nr:hypothetical protein LOC62_04G006184 [Vanrija pseudolonga]